MRKKQCERIEKKAKENRPLANSFCCWFLSWCKTFDPQLSQLSLKSGKLNWETGKIALQRVDSAGAQCEMRFSHTPRDPQQGTVRRTLVNHANSKERQTN